MQLTLNPPNSSRTKCLVLVGGSGDTAEGFAPLAQELVKALPDHSICSFSFSTKIVGESLLDVQAKELAGVVDQILNDNKFDSALPNPLAKEGSLDFFAASMGAYAMVKLLSNPKYAGKIGRVIFFDPADYYLSSHNYYSWTGAQEFAPTAPVVSDLLKDIQSNASVSVVHLTLRNYSAEGYIDSNYIDRGVDHLEGTPRLNSEMVKGFYTKAPTKSRGQYLEVGDIPHAILRDGNITQNIENVTGIISKLLA